MIPSCPPQFSNIHATNKHILASGEDVFTSDVRARMARASFSIRKLIRTWPDDDEEEEAFECSSARTIRMQYELEQYQIQHLQKGHHDHKHRSWMSNPSGPKGKEQRRIPQSTTVVGHASDGVLKSGSASRRISTPLPLYPLSDRISPATPLSLRCSEENLSMLRGDNVSKEQHQSQHFIVPRRSAKILGLRNPQVSRPLPSYWVDLNGPCSAPMTEKFSYEKPSSFHTDTTHLPGSGLRAHDDSLSSAGRPSPPPTKAPSHEAPNRTPTTTMTPAKAATNRSNRSSYVMDGRIQQPSAFVNGQPSPPLEPDEFQCRVSDSGEVLREIPSVSTLSLNGENEDLSEVSNHNVQQLIWETDEAFKAVSCALAEARQASQSPAPFENMRSPLQNLQRVSYALHEQRATAKRSPTVDEPQAMSPISPTPCIGRGSIAPHSKASKSPVPLSSVPYMLKSPMSASSISKSKKGSNPPQVKAMRTLPHESSPSRSPRESPARGTSGNRPHHSYHKSISRLNLAADKVTDKIFEGRNGRFGFIKVEADEVVTPEQVELFRRNRLAKQLAAAKRQVSDETLRSVANTTSITGDERLNDADVEPFHLQDLPSRLGNSAVNILSPVIEVATLDAFQLNKGDMGRMPILAGHKTFTEATKETKGGQDPPATPPPTPPQRPVDGTENDEFMNLQTLGFSNLSNGRLKHKRSASSTSHIASLPTIPEVKVTASQGRDVSRISQQPGPKTPDQNSGSSVTPTDASGNPLFEEDEEYMFFMSNTITSTMQSFQHGRIRLAKADLVNTGTINSLESKLLTSPDETLDWTAFQMAILGGAGDLFSDPDNFLSRDAQEEMVDDLCDWFEDLGFSNGDLGALVTSDTPRTAAASRASATPLQTAMMSTPGSLSSNFHDPLGRRMARVGSSSSSVGSGLTRSGDSPDHSIPIPVEAEYPSGFWNAPHSNNTDRFRTGPGLKRWTLEGHPKRYQGSGIDVNRANSQAVGGAGKGLPRTPGSGGRSVRASIDSLPQSPMLELRMMTGVDGNREFVSMGYNLNHDLGDFLKWESEHVHASGFYGTE